jgi:hypothetical protein
LDSSAAQARFGILEEAIKQGEMLADIDVEATIDILYAPIYYRLQMGTGPISESFVDKVFEQAMDGHKKQSAGDADPIAMLREPRQVINY